MSYFENRFEFVLAQFVHLRGHCADFGALRVVVCLGVVVHNIKHPALCGIHSRGACSFLVKRAWPPSPKSPYLRKTFFSYGPEPSETPPDPDSPFAGIDRRKPLPSLPTAHRTGNRRSVHNGRLEQRILLAPWKVFFHHSYDSARSV